MPPSLQQLLQALEEITAEIVRAIAPSEQGSLQLEIVGDLIQKRGILLGTLPESIAAGVPHSYSDYNRMVVLHIQGCQIDGQLKQIRAHLASEMTSRAAERAYAGCITGMLNSSEQHHVDTA